jgi:hypothetical protein
MHIRNQGLTGLIREADAADAVSCGSVLWRAFSAIANKHGFPCEFPSESNAILTAKLLISNPSVISLVAERDAEVIACSFMLVSDEIYGIGPIGVAPQHQREEVGKGLVKATLSRAKSARGVRLLQDGFNMTSLVVFRSCGLDVKEPVVLMRGRFTHDVESEQVTRPLTLADCERCIELHQRIHLFDRSNGLKQAAMSRRGFVVERKGQITGYLCDATHWQQNHGVAETETDMRALITGASAHCKTEIALLTPTRKSGLFCWCLEMGMHAVKPMTLMATGIYHEPKGCWFPSVLF